MNNRLQQFLAAENISQASLASSINVAPASISHVLQGRNKPSFDFLVSLVSRFPNLNMDWLLTGKGKMYKDTQGKDTLGVRQLQADSNDDNLFPPDDNLSSQFDEESIHPSLMNTSDTEANNSPHSIDTPPFSNDERRYESAIGKRSISKVIVFYDDSTFEEIK
jgi:transcriptional regulator with XRE-family HTH domain